MLARLPAVNAIGESVEWRGTEGATGFAPHAAIVRLRAKFESASVGDILAIVRIDHVNACLAAYVDVRANSDAGTLARTSADQLATEFQCGKDAPRSIGASTARVSQALALGE